MKTSPWNYRIGFSVSLLLVINSVVRAAGPTFYAGTGSYYEVVDTHASWNDALTAAAAKTFAGRQGRLATIGSADENAFVTSLLDGSNDSYWLGGFQDHSSPSYSEPSGGWRWITNEPFSYTNWSTATGEPNNSLGGEDFLEIFTGPGTWNDLGGTSGLSGGYVIEYAVPEPASVSILGILSATLLFRRRPKQ